MPIGLLDSQFQTLETLNPEECGKVFDIDKPIDEIVHEVVLWIEK
jgi:gluconokinase